MTDITYHIPDAMIRDYVSGRLSHAFSMVVAAHVSLCDNCRAQMEAEESAAGIALGDITPAPADDGAGLAAVLGRLDETPETEIAGTNVYPAPVHAALDQKPPRWRPLGAGIRQQILHADNEGSVRLLYIPPGASVPEHSHRGTELTLVLQGRFNDGSEHFGVGDVEVADDHIKHTPVAGEGLPCVCLAATEGALRFRSIFPRMLQPLFRI